MEKEPCLVLVTFYEVIKLQSFEFSVGDAIPANVQNISPLIFSLVLWRKNYLQRFTVFLTIFHELLKLISFE